MGVRFRLDATTAPAERTATQPCPGADPLALERARPVPLEVLFRRKTLAFSGLERRAAPRGSQRTSRRAPIRRSCACRVPPRERVPVRGTAGGQTDESERPEQTRNRRTSGVP